ncbi:hypothetical protein Acor_44800 [Acrocarpospora corrugata]|uniref:Uncharacterized protein n=1 Tax=Acrocarpospora corrugata TaxID=35763 RepID=A0A5M3W103_9ACTN|nr:hypothetical protein [Acrocarpospora corrugata]GES02414.1 hypothetical protein Acor_44800 [Acrocarpospora corrugata]
MPSPDPDDYPDLDDIDAWAGSPRGCHHPKETVSEADSIPPDEPPGVSIPVEPEPEPG